MLALLFKTVCFISIAILVRGTLPRYRIDQLLTLNWKFWVFLLISFYVHIILLNLFVLS